MTTTADMQSNAITGPNVHAAPPQTLPWSTAARALVVPCERRLWRPFWLLLAVAFLLRLFAAYYGHWYWRHDEVFQYLEQAHRVVFGYGLIPWEYRHGARSWLTPGMVMPPLYLAKVLELDNPTTYAVLVNSWNALLSMTIPVCSYLVARRLLPEKAARWTLVFTCFWYEFIILAPRTLAEIYATLFFMAGLAAGAGNNRKRWFVAGFLLGIALAFRPHYAPLVAIVGILWLWQLRWALSVAAVIGGSAGLLLWGLVDLFTRDGWWGSVLNYYEYFRILFDGTADHERNTHWRLIAHLSIASFGLYPLLICAAFADARRYWPLLLLIPLTLVLYSLHYSQEYSNVFVYLPLLWIIAGSVTMKLNRISQQLGRLCLAVFAVVSSAGAAGKLPFNYYGTFATTSFFSTSPLWQIARNAHDLLKDEKDAVLVFNMDIILLDYGGFYNLHLNIPVLHLSFDGNVYDIEHKRIWDKYYEQGMESFATHVISFTDFHNPAFDKQPIYPDVYLYTNKQKPTVKVADEWIYDYVNPILNTKEKLPPRAYTPYNPDL